MSSLDNVLSTMNSSPSASPVSVAGHVELPFSSLTRRWHEEIEPIRKQWPLCISLCISPSNLSSTQKPYVINKNLSMHGTNISDD